MRVFVFGSNQLGIHGAGAAKTARDHWGAIHGQGIGFAAHSDGDRGSYAIPTKVTPYRRLDLTSIRSGVKSFLEFAEDHPEWTFLVTRIGCGLAGFTDAQIAPMFTGAPDNCEFDPKWKPWGLKSWTEAP